MLWQPARWHATVTYRTDAGPLDVPMLLREIGDLQDWIEDGPHWDTIAKSRYNVNHIDSRNLLSSSRRKCDVRLVEPGCGRIQSRHQAG